MDASKIQFTDFSNLSEDELQLQWEESEKLLNSVSRHQANLFAAAFVHYFHKNPDAELIIIGNGDTSSSTDFDGFGVFRIDTDYVAQEAKAQNNLIKREKISTDYEFKKEKIDKYPHTESTTGFPSGWRDLYISSFYKFTEYKTMHNIWKRLSAYQSDMEPCAVLYNRNSLDTLLSHFRFSANELQELKSNIESFYLKTSCAADISPPIQNKAL